MAITLTLQERSNLPAHVVGLAHYAPFATPAEMSEVGSVVGEMSIPTAIGGAAIAYAGIAVTACEKIRHNEQSSLGINLAKLGTATLLLSIAGFEAGQMLNRASNQIRLATLKSDLLSRTFVTNDSRNQDPWTSVGPLDTRTIS